MVSVFIFQFVPQMHALLYIIFLFFRYRFRLVSNAITNCPLKISVDSHNMTVIASDGSPVEPFETEILVIYGGERFDVVVNANQIVGNYWIRVKGLADCRKVR